MPSQFKCLLTPDNCTTIFIDPQPQTAFGITSINRQSLANNVIALARTANVFHVPTIVTALKTRSFTGKIWTQLMEILPGTEVIERTSMNSWEDEAFVAEVERIGRNKLVLAALGTEACLTFSALYALEEGFEVYIVTDASGGTTPEAHTMAVHRMIQAGAVPVTWLQVLLEFQRDWSREDTYDAVMAIVEQHSGAYIGGEYAHVTGRGHKRLHRTHAGNESPATTKASVHDRERG